MGNQVKSSRRKQTAYPVCPVVFVVKSTCFNRKSSLINRKSPDFSVVQTWMWPKTAISSNSWWLANSSKLWGTHRFAIENHYFAIESHYSSIENHYLSIENHGLSAEITPFAAIVEELEPRSADLIVHFIQIPTFYTNSNIFIECSILPHTNFSIFDTKL